MMANHAFQPSRIQHRRSAALQAAADRYEGALGRYRYELPNPSAKAERELVAAETHLQRMLQEEAATPASAVQGEAGGVVSIGGAATQR
jgi:hypothetical protein